MEGFFIVGDERVIKKLRSSEEVIREEMSAATAQVAIEMQSLVEMFVPKRTWNLAKATFVDSSFGVSGKAFTTKITAGVGPEAPYGVFVERGTGIYGKYHRPFEVTVGEVTYMHPGMMAQPFIEPSFEMMGPRSDEIWEECGHKIARRLN